MATTTNYGWTTPDDTALVKDGAAAIRTLGSSVDTTTKALNPSTTLGDIEYRSATANTNTRLGIGSTGDVLTVAGGVPTWAATASGPTNWTLLNAGGTALTAAQTITISGINAKQLLILIDSASSVSASSTMTLRINGDTSTNYTQFGLYANPLIQNTTSPGYTYSGQTNFQIGKMDSDASSKVASGIFIDLANETGIKMVDIVGAGTNQGSDNSRSFVTKGIYEASAAITSISVNSDIGNFDLGTIYVLGAN